MEYTPDSVRHAISTTAAAVAKAVYTQLNALVSNALAALFHFIIIVLMLFYILMDGRRFKRYLFRLSPLPDEEEELIVTKFADVGRAILFGNGIGSALQGVLGGVAMAVVGLPSPVLGAR
ncbi:MAG: AI-2E family transporter [Deltaproteobacteria bacterium]|nr:AI-2E family transporter [Deltaproteobacteria bacterium]